VVHHNSPATPHDPLLKIWGSRTPIPPGLENDDLEKAAASIEEIGNRLKRHQIDRKLVHDAEDASRNR